MKYFIIAVVLLLAAASQSSIVKELFGDAAASLAAFKQLADLYNDVEPKEQWDAAKCKQAKVIITDYCATACNYPDATDSCERECAADFEGEFKCEEFEL